MKAMNHYNMGGMFYSVRVFDRNGEFLFEATTTDRAEAFEHKAMYEGQGLGMTGKVFKWSKDFPAKQIG